MGENTTQIFVVLICFWTLLTLGTYAFGEELTGTHISEFMPNEGSDVSGWKSFIGGIFDSVENLPILNVFVPLMKIMTYNYVDGLPLGITLFLQVTLILSAYVVYTMLRGY